MSDTERPERLWTVDEVRRLFRKRSSRTIKRWHADPDHPLTGFHTSRNALVFKDSNVKATLEWMERGGARSDTHTEDPAAAGSGTHTHNAGE